MSRSPKDFLGHIAVETAFIIDVSKRSSKSEFVDDPVLTRAIVRSLEVIGEATKNLPNSLKKQYPEIPWRQMAGMRDKLIHQYFGVDYDIVWDIVTEEIPALHARIRTIVEQ
ncbi:MAG: DUF86 domain-containing protein [Geitlerinemataceae cyanobacterium]